MNANEICSLIDADLVNFIHNVIVLIKIAVPVVLVIFGMLDFMKGVIASKEDEIKKGQQVFIKRIIAAFIVFFMITIVQLVMNFASDDGSIWGCADAILNGTSSTNGGSGGGNTNTKPSDVPANSVKCNSDSAMSEYIYCSSNLYSDDSCATFFQDVCTVDGIEPIWPSATNFSKDALNGVSCAGKTDDTKYTDILEKQFYSCLAYIETTPANETIGAFNYCLSYMSGYCGK